MSWAEVKKALNTNIDVPLNELIEQVDSVVTPEAAGYQCVASNFTGSGTHTILSVTGKGRLRGAMIYDYNTSTTASKCEIIIDGVSYVLQVKNSTSNNGYKYFALVNPSDVLFNVYGSNATTTGYVYGAHYPMGNIYPNREYSKFIQELDNVTHNLSGYDIGVWMYLDKYIPFKESLVIKCTVNTTNANNSFYGVCYRLDD